MVMRLRHLLPRLMLSAFTTLKLRMSSGLLQTSIHGAPHSFCSRLSMRLVPQNCAGRRTQVKSRTCCRICTCFGVLDSPVRLRLRHLSTIIFQRGRTCCKMRRSRWPLARRRHTHLRDRTCHRFIRCPLRQSQVQGKGCMTRDIDSQCCRQLRPRMSRLRLKAP